MIINKQKKKGKNNPKRNNQNSQKKGNNQNNIQGKQKRNTNQKLKILAYLRSVKTHPTAEQVYQEVKKELPALTLATVYRNLNQMAENGEILRLEINKEYHYDADISFHQHFICEKCRKVFDFFSAEELALIHQEAKKRNFQLHDIDITLRGICPHCQN